MSHRELKVSIPKNSLLLSLLLLALTSCTKPGNSVIPVIGPVTPGTADGIGGGDNFTTYLYQVRDNVLLPAVDSLLAGAYSGNLCDFSYCEQSGAGQKICRRVPVLNAEQRSTCHLFVIAQLQSVRAKLVDAQVPLLGMNESFQTETDSPLMRTTLSASGPIRASRNDIDALGLDEYEIAALLFHEYLHKIPDASGKFTSDDEVIGAFTGPRSGSAALTAAGYAVAIHAQRPASTVAGGTSPIQKPELGPPLLFVTGGLKAGSAVLEIASASSLISTSSHASKAIAVPYDANKIAGPAAVAGDFVGDGVKRILIADQQGALRVFDANGISLPMALPVYPMGDTYRDPLNLALGDVTGDGRLDVLVGHAGHNVETRVRIFDGATGLLIREFAPYAPTFGGGVYLASADVNGDGKAEILTGAGPSGGPHVRLFDGVTGNIISQSFVYNSGFTGGVHVALGDTNGDGRPEIITGAGSTGGPHVRVLDALTFQPVVEFYAWQTAAPEGVRVAAGDINGDGKAEIFAAPSQNMNFPVRVFNATSTAVLIESSALVPAGSSGHYGLFFGRL